MVAAWRLVVFLLGAGCAASLPTPSQVEAFTHWLEDAGGGFHPNVRLEVNPTSRLRVVTTTGLRSEQQVVSVPPELLITPHTANITEPGFSPSERVALALALERLKGKRSLWVPYLELLPRAPLDTALYYTTEDDAELAHTYTSVLVQQERVAFAALVQRVQASPTLASVAAGAGHPTLRWAVSIVSSRAFTIAKPSAVDHPLHLKPFLAPGADLLNHSPSALVGWKLGPHPQLGDAQDSFRIFCRQAYPRTAMEVFNQYQDFGNPRLLTNYGFTIDNNPHDAVPIRLAVPTTGPKAVFLKALGLAPSQEITRGGVSPALLNLVRVLALNDGALSGPQFHALALMNQPPEETVYDVAADGSMVPSAVEAAPLPKSTADGLPAVDARTQHIAVSPDVDVLAHRMLFDALSQMLSRYPHDVGEDRKLLAGEEDPGVGRSSKGKMKRAARVQRRGRRAAASDVSSRRRQIIMCRLSEMEVLKTAISWLHHRLTQSTVGKAAAPAQDDSGLVVLGDDHGETAAYQPPKPGSVPARKKPPAAEPLVPAKKKNATSPGAASGGGLRTGVKLDVTPQDTQDAAQAASP